MRKVYIKSLQLVNRISAHIYIVLNSARNIYKEITTASETGFKNSRPIRNLQFNQTKVKIKVS